MEHDYIPENMSLFIEYYVKNNIFYHLKELMDWRVTNYPQRLNATNSAGDTVLHLVLKHCGFQTLRFILQFANLNLNATGANQKIPLELCLKSPKMFKLLLNDERTLLPTGNAAVRIIDYLVEHKHTELLQALKQKGMVIEPSKAKPTQQQGARNHSFFSCPTMPSIFNGVVTKECVSSLGFVGLQLFIDSLTAALPTRGVKWGVLLACPVTVGLVYGLCLMDGDQEPVGPRPNLL